MSEHFKGWYFPPTVDVYYNRGRQAQDGTPFVTLIDPSDTTNAKYAQQSAGGPAQATKESFDNKGFIVGLDFSMNAYSSFPTFIAKGQQRFSTSISTRAMAKLMETTVFVNGCCTTDVSFARKQSEWYPIHPAMDLWAEIQEDVRIKEQIDRGRTTKHLIGVNYMTMNENDVYLGDCYQHYQAQVLYGRGTNAYRMMITPITPARQMKIFVPYRTIKTISERPVSMRQLLEDTMTYANTNVTRMSPTYFNFLISNNVKDKLPARAPGEVCITNDATPEMWNTYRDFVAAKTLDYNRGAQTPPDYYFNALAMSFDPNVQPPLTALLTTEYAAAHLIDITRLQQPTRV